MTAERERPAGDPAEVPYSEAVEAVRSYYNSDDARRVYETAYGDEHLHLGIYENDDDTIDEAGQRTMERMASMTLELGPSTRVLDIGAGHGGSARYLFRQYGCHVACLNLSDVQNARNRDLNARNKCSLAINVVDGSFEDIPVTDESFDVVWSQDAILHSSRRRQVFAEVGRVLCKGGQFIFTDPMRVNFALPKPCNPSSTASTSTPWDPFGSTGRCCQRWVFRSWSSSTSRRTSPPTTDESSRNCWPMSRICRSSAVQHWVDGGKRGYLQWGILHFRKD